MDVKDDEGQVVRATYTMQVVVHPDNQLRGSFVSNTNGIAKNGQKIQLTATSSGGYDNAHRYRFREVYGGNNKVYKIILLKSHVNLRSQEMEHIHIM